MPRGLLVAATRVLVGGCAVARPRSARGYLGQYVVVPSADLVVARFGSSHGPGHDAELVGRLVADVIAALGA